MAKCISGDVGLPSNKTAGPRTLFGCGKLLRPGRLGRDGPREGSEVQYRQNGLIVQEILIWEILDLSWGSEVQGKKVVVPIPWDPIQLGFPGCSLVGWDLASLWSTTEVGGRQDRNP